MKTTMGIIPIKYDNEEITVLGRDLHAALEVKTRYNDWFKRMCEYGFEEGVDYIKFSTKKTKENPDEPNLGGRPAENHQLTLSMAKEIAMIQRTPIGRKARQYFIQSDENHSTYSPEEFFNLLGGWKNNTKTPKFCVYLMGMDNSTVKIGVSSNFYQRLDSIQSASGLWVLKWAHTDYIDKPTAYKVEKTCHKHFNGFRTQGEFFNISWKAAYDYLNSKSKIIQRECA